jgi:Fe-S oxidoreductase
MINEKIVENIRRYGAYQDSGEARHKVLAKDIGFRMDQKAEYVVIGGCLQPQNIPHVFRALKGIFEHLKVDYTFLSREYCCGWVPLGQPAVMAKNEEEIAKFKELARSFVVENFRQAEALGAKSIVLFCAACEPSYSNCKDATQLEIVSYVELLDRHFQGGRLNLEVDYYPGCYRFRRRITTEPIDVEPAMRVLQKIEGLEVNQLDSKLCCYIPPHLEQLTGSLKTNNLVTICTGCYINLKQYLQEKDNYRVRMLPEVVLEALQDK